MADLDILDAYRPLFYPRSIAVVGASSNPFKLGFHALLAAKSAGFAGEIFAVNPKAGEEIQGVKAFRRISDLPDNIDLFVYAIPDKMVVPAVREAVEKGGRAGVIFAGGFREVGPDGVKLQRALVEAAGRGGMKLIGPNCIGVVNTHVGLNATFAVPLGGIKKGGVSVVSQSGGVGMCIVSHLFDEGVGLGKFVSIGNRANVEFADMVEYLALDPDTSVICLFIEGIDDARQFLMRARKYARLKPVIAYNRGYTEKSSGVALSHTGSMASSEEVYRGAFRQAGIIQAESLVEMAVLAKCFSMGVRLEGNGVFMCTHTAGPAIVIADICERAGVRFPELEPKIAEAMREFLPPHSVPGNPLDMFAQAWTNSSLYLKATDLALRQKNIHCAVAVFQSGMGAGPAFPAREFSQLGHRYGKPTFLCLTAPQAFAKEMEEAQNQGVVTFNRAEKTGAAIVGLTRLLKESRVHDRKK